jgi:hypothetical protein
LTMRLRISKNNQYTSNDDNSGHYFIAKNRAIH